MTLSREDRNAALNEEPKAIAMYEDAEFRIFIERTLAEIDLAKVDSWLRITFDLVA